MNLLRRSRRSLAITLSTGLALSITAPSFAQLPPPPSSGPSLSTGSGAGTGTGLESGGPNATGTGLESGGGARLRMPDYRPFGRRMPRIQPYQAVPLGPGADVTFPDNPSLAPLDIRAGITPGASLESNVQPDQLKLVRAIPAASERSLALQRMANVAIFSSQLGIAQTALAEAAQAAELIEEPVVRDQRLIAIITSLITLAEAHLREGKSDLAVPDLTTDAAAPLPKVDRQAIINRARLEWRRAAFLAGRIENPTFRSEMLFRVVDNQAYGSLTVANDFPRGQTDAKSPSNGTKPAFESMTNTILSDAAVQAHRIERPVWRDQALLSVASYASLSWQFKLGREIAHSIPQPEVRSNALIKIADAEARRGDPREATEAYRETADAIASIPLDDIRAVLAGVLIDNLVANGRFADARASIALYPDAPRKLIALGAIAESEGRRGGADRAREWIAREVPAQYQSQLVRRVEIGVLTAVEQNRSRDLSNRER